MTAPPVVSPTPPVTSSSLAVPSLPVAPVPSITPIPPTDAQKVTVQQYLEMERRSDIRHEYVNGEIIAMAGETPAHNRIARNICVLFENAFVDNSCESFIEGIRVRVTPTQYRYPDVVALCDAAQFDSDTPPALLNPAVIVEVLSPSTQEFDQNEKFLEYRQVATVTDYVLVSQDRIEVTHYARQSAERWLVTIYTTRDGKLEFASLNTSLSLADIYRKIEIEESTT